MTLPVTFPVTLPVTSPVKSPTNAVEVIELNPVPTPPVNCAVPSDTIGNCTFLPDTVDTISSSAKVLPASCKVYPALRLLFVWNYHH